jgi:hypothetical protein
MTPPLEPRTDAMTIHRRFRRRLAAACVLTPGLLAGCANSSQFTAGRLPYGGAQTASAEAAPQDPFAAQRGGSASIPVPADGRQDLNPGAFAQNGAGSPQTFATAQTPQAGFPQGGQAPAGLVPHQAAYAQPSGNPFEQAASETSPFSDQTEWATFETPAAPPAESNPFAEIEGRPAVARRTAAPAESLPQITPKQAAGSPWQPRGQMAASQSADEFLPPVR